MSTACAGDPDSPTTSRLPCAPEDSSPCARRSSSALASPASAAHSSTSVAAASADSSPSAAAHPHVRGARSAHRDWFSRVRHSGVILAHLAKNRVKDAVDEARRLGPAELLRGLDGLVDRALRRYRLLAPGPRRRASISTSATRRIVRSSGAILSIVQPCAWWPISPSSSAWRCSTGGRQGAGEGRASRGSVSSSGRPEVVLVGGDTAARRWSVRRGPAGSRARHVIAGARVDADSVADVDEQRHLNLGPGLEHRGLGPAARRGVAANPRLGLA